MALEFGSTGGKLLLLSKGRMTGESTGSLGGEGVAKKESSGTIQIGNTGVGFYYRINEFHSLSLRFL